MMPRIIEIDDPAAAAREILAVGCERAGVNIMAPKAVQRVLKLKGLRPAAANIIKQEMLSLGGEAANAFGAINCSVRSTDVLIFGTLKQIQFLVKKLKFHQFGLPEVADRIAVALSNYDSRPAPLRIGKKIFKFGARTYVMGILNVTPDSFSDGGKFLRCDEAIARAEKMIAEGADIIDVGGESTRPGARAVPAGEEISRVIPVIKQLSRRPAFRTGKRGAVISVDTRKAAVARAALEAGADMVNDVSALRYDREMAAVAADFGVPVCLMHARGLPANMQKNPVYKDLLGEIIESLEQSLAIAKNAGILLGKIILDPGIGFGKTVEHNLEIFRRLRELRVLGRPVMVGPSRKSTIGKVMALPVEERLEGTAAVAALCVANGADIVRVHDVKAMARVVRMTDAMVRRRGNG